MLPSSEKLNVWSGEILSSAIEVHRHMGPGLLESIYQHCMVAELRSRNLQVQQLVPISLSYKKCTLEKNFLIDLVVESEIILELKAVEEIIPVHEAQILSYLKLTGKRLGLLINFNVPLLKHGIKRFVNNL
jgi:GxxExxY protein